MLKITVGFLILICCNLPTTAEADTKPQLEAHLTPFGATRAGNGSTIPEWTGESLSVTDDEPIFTIDASNYQQYKNHLSAGQLALFQRYPDSFSMPIFPSRRTFSAPDEVYKNTAINALKTSLNKSSTGFENARGGIPFPLPKSALEVYFNHIGRWRGTQLQNTTSDAVIQRNGKFSLVTRKTIIRFDSYISDIQSDNFVSLVSRITAPALKSGNGILVLEPLDQFNNSRLAWFWDKGRRRTIRAPNIAYDQPVQSAQSLRTADDADLINGSPDRFNWELLEKRELYIPYNNERLSSKQLRYKELLKKHHINPQYTRYELHRVWVIQATLKNEWRHVYSRRDFYLDEDSWQVVIADQYDKNGELWRVSMSYSKFYADLPGIFPVINVFHDLHKQLYSVMGLQNERKTSNQFNQEVARNSLFTPAGLKRFVQ